MTSKTLLLLAFGLFSLGSFSQQDLGKIFPDDYYYDALDSNYQKKKKVGLKAYAVVNGKGIGLYISSNWTSNNLVLDALKSYENDRTYIDVRSEKWSFEFNNEEFHRSKAISDTLYQNRGYNSEPSEDYYVLIPSMKYIVCYGIVEGNIELKKVYTQSLTAANEFKDEQLILGLIEQMEKNIDADIEKEKAASIKEKEETLNARELPKAKSESSKLEAKLLAAIQEYGADYGWKETFTDVIITSDWWFIRNEYSGRITGRAIEIAAIATWPDGHCTYQYFNIAQEATDNLGKEFGKLYRSGTGSQYDILCEKVK